MTVSYMAGLMLGSVVSYSTYSLTLKAHFIQTLKLNDTHTLQSYMPGHWMSSYSFSTYIRRDTIPGETSSHESSWVFFLVDQEGSAGEAWRDEICLLDQYPKMFQHPKHWPAMLIFLTGMLDQIKPIQIFIYNHPFIPIQIFTVNINCNIKLPFKLIYTWFVHLILAGWLVSFPVPLSIMFNLFYTACYKV